MFLIGLGIGSLASQLGAVTESALPDEQSGEVGGLQNTATNLGASLGTTLAGSVLITILTSSAITGIQQNPEVPPQVRASASVELASGVPFLSETQLRRALDEAQAPKDLADKLVEVNAQARVEGLRAALSLLAPIAVVSLVFTGAIPSYPPGSAHSGDDSTSADAA